MTLIEDLRAEARAAPESGIVAVMNRGRGRDGMIPLWAGEGDLPTPSTGTGSIHRPSSRCGSRRETVNAGTFIRQLV